MTQASHKLRHTVAERQPIYPTPQCRDVVRNGELLFEYYPPFFTTTTATDIANCDTQRTLRRTHYRTSTRSGGMV
ncbi:hypothetical protein PAXINDRAFT_172413 [Paxillus involutus ATCC 200175]|uniref:Uncharacterized protein n=1 Tax=Paxillus involutus ATCC 200175 TaxID=664439 RepID=A0A0C9TRD0_PAXIN|nr:hypothetical protein PAXINDRAFT_172413 [Paxillus involutus ATCC 200175]